MSDCLTVITLCNEKIDSNPNNQKALYMRATAFIRVKEYQSVAPGRDSCVGNEGRDQAPRTRFRER